MPNEIKLKRYESLILSALNKTICFEVENKLAKQGRITYVKLTNDLSICKAYVETTDRDQAPKVAAALNQITGLFRSRVCEVLDIYKTPKILFEIDKSIDYAENIDRILDNITKKE